MQITTSISSDKNNQHYLRDKKLTDLLAKHSFTDVVFLLWRGDFPSKREAALLEAVLIAAVEHGVAVPSLYIPRVVASTGNDMHTALAAGMLAIGRNHGGAIEPAAKLFSGRPPVRDLVASYLRAKRALPGFGHPVYKDEDLRATAIYKKARQLKFRGRAFAYAYQLERELHQQKGKKIPLNVDGAMAAGLLEAGLPWQLGQAAFLLARLVGMAAHVYEEQQQKNPYYRL